MGLKNKCLICFNLKNTYRYTNLSVHIFTYLSNLPFNILSNKFIRSLTCLLSPHSIVRKYCLSWCNDICHRNVICLFPRHSTIASPICRYYSPTIVFLLHKLTIHNMVHSPSQHTLLVRYELILHILLYLLNTNNL